MVAVILGLYPIYRLEQLRLNEISVLRKAIGILQLLIHTIMLQYTLKSGLRDLYILDQRSLPLDSTVLFLDIVLSVLGSGNSRLL